MRLYEWNCAVSAALFETLGDVEIVLRNTLHDELTAWHGTQAGFWYDDVHGLLTVEARENIATARKRIAKNGKVETPGAVVAELSFGFWRYLLIKQYKATLWRWALRKGFPNLGSSEADADKLFSRVRRLHVVRNRIAHHEQIHTRKLHADLMDCRMTVRAICEDTESWVMGRERVSGLLADRP